MRCCLYSESAADFKKFAKTNSENILKLGNKFRACVLFNDSNNLRLDTFNKDLFIKTHEIYSPFLTYVCEEGKELAHPSLPIVSSVSNTFWISDVDLWVGLPPAMKNKMLSLGSHVLCFDDFAFINEL
jgi:hypothetical protein